MKVPYPTFWVVALLSNVVGAAQVVAVAWLLADPRFSIAVLVTLQAADVLGTLVGVAVGTVVVARMGYRGALVLACSLEAAFCLTVAFVAYTPTAELTSGQAYAVALVSGLAPFTSAIAGPAWLALVSRWPGTSSETRQLLLDGVQFQIGGFLGPLAAGAVIAASAHALQWLAALNSLSYVLIAGIARVMTVVADRGAAQPGIRSDHGLLRRLVASPAGWGLAVFALATESSRIYLPRILRQAGGDAATLTVVLAIIAGAAAVAAAAASRIRPSDRRLSTMGLVGVGSALAVWAAAPLVGGPVWYAGAVVMGAAVGVVAAPLTNMLMHEAGEDRRSGGAAAAMAIRTTFGALGGVAFGVVVPVLGALAFAGTAVTTLAMARVLHRRSPDHESRPALSR